MYVSIWYKRHLQAQLCRPHEEEKRKNPADCDDPVTSAVTTLTRVEIWWYNLRVCLTIVTTAVSGNSIGDLQYDMKNPQKDSDQSAQPKLCRVTDFAFSSTSLVVSDGSLGLRSIFPSLRKTSVCWGNIWGVSITEAVMKVIQPTSKLQPARAGQRDDEVTLNSD